MKYFRDAEYYANSWKGTVALDGGEILEIILAVCGVPDGVRHTVHICTDTAMTMLLWTVSVYLALNGVGEGLLISSLYMVFSRCCFTHS